MKADYPGLKKEMIPLLLLGASAVFAVLILVKVTSFFAESAWAEGLVKRAVGQDGPDDEQIKGVIAKSCAVADELKKANFFSPPEPKQHPVTSVLGILGDEVLIGDKWYKAGDQVQDARIVAVEPTQVRIEWDGREKIFAPLETTGQLGSGGARRTSRSPRLVARGNSPARRPPQMVRTERSGPSGKEPAAQKSEKSQQRLDKQRPATEKKELQRASRDDVKKPQPDKKKKSPEEIKKAKEQTAQKKPKKRAQK